MNASARSVLGAGLILALAAGMILTPLAAQERRVVRIVVPQDERTINPYTYNTGYPGHNLLLMIYDSLFQSDQKGEPRPWLAREASVDASGKVWTVRLAEGARWADGRPVTSADVKFSYEYFASEAGTHGRFSPPTRVIERIDAPNPATVVFTLKSPQPGFILRPMADNPIIPAHIWRGVTDPQKFTNSVGSGPYRVADYRPDQFYRLTASPDYFKGRPRVDEINMVVIKDLNAQFTAYQAGEVDAVAQPVPPELIGQLRNRRDTRLVEGPGFATMTLLFNMDRSPFRFKAFRQAVDYAVNEKELVDTVLVGRGVIASPGFVSPELSWANSDLRARYDPERAKRLLDSLNIKDRDGDGMREDAQGRRLAIDLVTQSDDPLRVRTIELIASDLAKVGLRVNARALDRATVISMVWPEFDVRKGRSFDLAVILWSAPVQQDRFRLIDMLHSNLEIGALNLGAYKNLAADRLATAFSQETNPQRALDLGRRLQALIADEVPFLALFFPQEAYAVRPAVYDGWRFSNFIAFFNKLSLVPNELVR